ncbi:bis(5'-nucleosyl)-tetraphosphatase (symmetrical) YqeK [Defluviitalea raffinosedens]|jgi:nicotinate-nucleotide adenylyltransferase|uniref:bis(5'-nucleosyl)-tetraphosphatase (symmetrical) n=1 Tax=Defluviitalea raffinosedens TaxID=1450156 RepID=A0A7C8HGI2_9FIRM|nr:bis(5'-nucleosyl)-tetraphosphatase (symmetrical) YqeK [Defluviitalea raffinosedens]KAE9637289.1 HD domain-containing protein [Defluviitalea raffinosedens]MBM7685594.1 putative HD superfamily hydrolase involved in NAD metabolism [Defluviitalea raffinosedens]MBZ4668621.1 nadD 1 [Defluviitaleaceae bacterium]HHW66677.1 HD domain-containing protein [Candidatus Epulonipiscium sp.]
MLEFKDMQEKLQSALSPKRFIHTLGVVETALQLGHIYNIDEEKVKVSALLHDCAKDIPNTLKLRLCKEYHIPLDEILLQDIELSHSFLGAEIAKRDYRVKDEEILNAIRYHTTGRAHMSVLEKIIYLADYIEPNRTSFKGLEEVRQYVTHDLDRAMETALKNTIEYLAKNDRVIHPLTIEALEFIHSKKED